MRIIAGVAKGRPLAEVASATRPTSDRAREAIFSSLTSEFGDFAGLNFLDLFAGSGAIGLEAQSRGAHLVHAVEKDFGAQRTINANIEIVAAAKPNGKFALFAMSAENFVSDIAKVKYEIVYVDPPYDYSNSDLEKVLTDLHLNGFLSDDSLIAVERTSRSKEPIWPIGYELARSKNYGQATIYYLNHA
jgi:16S rRNA (guanine966-N2)-methyltransferase